MLVLDDGGGRFSWLMRIYYFSYWRRMMGWGFIGKNGKGYITTLKSWYCALKIDREIGVFGPEVFVLFKVFYSFFFPCSCILGRRVFFEVDWLGFFLARYSSSTFPFFWPVGSVVLLERMVLFLHSTNFLLVLVYGVAKGTSEWILSGW